MDHTTSATKMHSSEISTHAPLDDPVRTMIPRPHRPGGVVTPARKCRHKPFFVYRQFRFEPSKPLVGVQQLPVVG